MKTLIYVVDEHALFRKGLSVLINAEPDMEVIGESDDCAAGTGNILKTKPDLVIADIFLRGSNGIEFIKNIKAVEPGIQIVVLSQHDESIYALRVLRAGAQAYVMKQDAATAVLAAIRCVRKGQLYVSENIASQMLNCFAHGGSLRDDSPVSGLSDRELEVLNLIGSGMPTREIAQRLHVSVKTVETHRAHIKTKLNLATSSQLVQFGVRWVDRNEHVPRRGVAPPMAETAVASELAAPSASSAGDPLRDHPVPQVPAARHPDRAPFPRPA